MHIGTTPTPDQFNVTHIGIRALTSAIVLRYKNSLFDRKIVQYYKDYRTITYKLYDIIYVMH